MQGAWKWELQTPAPSILHRASSPSDLLDSADYAADTSGIDLAARSDPRSDALSSHGREAKQGP